MTATLPSTVDHEVPTIALFAHVDTAREVSGQGSPQRVAYDGDEIALGDSGQSIRPTESPELSQHVGHELIVTDGTTLLGADDKAGVAEIMAAVAYLVAHPEIPHGTVKVAFNPDEEVGRGVVHFPVESFGVAAAYTVDGSTTGELQSETFSGAQVRMHIHGRAIHPGWAKGELVNAIKLAGEILSRLPQDRLSPETTQGREGFVHPSRSRATRRRSSCASSSATSRTTGSPSTSPSCAVSPERSPPPSRAAPSTVEDRIQYRNMRDALAQHPEIVANLEEAIRRVGLEPQRTSIRGGTDGSALTQMGLPTPNIFTGGHDAHSEREWICVEDMGLAAATLVELARVWAEYRA